MVVDCPECGASLEGASGTEMVCPACMTPFLVPSSARAVRAFDVQAGGDGLTQRMSRYAIREAIYLGRLTASARVRHDGGRWELIGGYPEFASVFRLLGGDLAPMAGTRKLAGWGKSAPASEPSSPRVAKPAPPAPASRPEPTREPSREPVRAEPPPRAAALEASVAHPPADQEVSSPALPALSADDSGSVFVGPPPRRPVEPAAPVARRDRDEPVPVRILPRQGASDGRKWLLGGLLVGLVILGLLLR